MSETRDTYTTKPVAEPVYYTEQEIWQASGDAYRAWRSYGHSEDSAAKDASEFYAYQIAQLHKRRAAGA